MVATPLSTALLTKQPYHVIELLLSQGADINNDPVIWKTHYMSRLVRSSNTQLLELLLSHGMDPNKTDEHELGLLHQALLCRDDICVAVVLLRYGAYKWSNDHNVDLIWVAYNNQNIEKMSLLLRYGSDINNTDEHGWTMLHHAARKDDADMVKWLLDHGAKSDIRCSRGELPIHKAIHHDGPDVMEIIGLLGGSIYALL